MPTSAPRADEPVTAAEANRGFSRLLRGVREGASYVVTSHGRPVARIVPAEPAVDEAKIKARMAFLEELKSRPVLNIGPWTRDELHDE